MHYSINMPELPEVESVRRLLNKYIQDKIIISTKVHMPKIIAGKGAYRRDLPDTSQEFVTFCKERTITTVDRRAKNLIIRFDNKTCLLVHFKMSGQLLYYNSKEEFTGQKHIHIIWELDKGFLVYKDVRQFGYVLPISDPDFLKDHFAGLGQEPLDAEFEYETFAKIVKSKTKSLKKIFLDQDAVVGLGNIYADEVCFRCQVQPMRSGKSLDEIELQSLFEEIPIILNESIAKGGTTKYTHTLPDGEIGQFSQTLQVYGRGGEPCMCCRTTLESTKHAGRTTVYCSSCQK